MVCHNYSFITFEKLKVSYVNVSGSNDNNDKYWNDLFQLSQWIKQMSQVISNQCSLICIIIILYYSLWGYVCEFCFFLPGQAVVLRRLFQGWSPTMLCSGAETEHRGVFPSSSYTHVGRGLNLSGDVMMYCRSARPFVSLLLREQRKQRLSDGVSEWKSEGGSRRAVCVCVFLYTALMWVGEMEHLTERREEEVDVVEGGAVWR